MSNHVHPFMSFLGSIIWMFFSFGSIVQFNLRTYFVKHLVEIEITNPYRPILNLIHTINLFNPHISFSFFCFYNLSYLVVYFLLVHNTILCWYRYHCEISTTSLIETIFLFLFLSNLDGVMNKKWNQLLNSYS